MGERQACERPSHSRRQAQPLCAGAAISGRQAGPIGFVVDAESRPCEYRCPAKVSEQHRLGPEAGGSPHAALGGHAIQAARRGLFQGLPLHALPAERADDQLVSAPWKLIQTPGVVVILYENSTIYRQIFTDGRVLSKDADPAFMGYSVGHWEGDTLVVETTGYNDKTWLDFSGHPHTDALRMTERFRRIDIGHLEIQFTFDDPKAYTKPWTVTINPLLFTDGDLLESICTDNEKDLHRVTGK